MLGIFKILFSTLLCHNDMENTFKEICVVKIDQYTLLT